MMKMKAQLARFLLDMSRGHGHSLSTLHRVPSLFFFKRKNGREEMKTQFANCADQTYDDDDD